MCLRNSGAPRAVVARITVSDSAAYTEELGEVGQGQSVKPIHVTDISAPAKLIVELLRQHNHEVLARKELRWQPQKKWKVFCVSFSHQDFGYRNYPHRIRTDNREDNITESLRLCSQTDSWDSDSQFRYLHEISEPVPTLLSHQNEAVAAELGRRIREGRLQIGALHTTVGTEQLSYELMARLFYGAGRILPDLLSAPPSRTGQDDDVAGLTWPLPTYCAAADVPYFFHGRTATASEMQPANSEPVFYWQGPDGRSRLLMRTTPYATYKNGFDPSKATLQKAIDDLGPQWTYDSMLLQIANDFARPSIDFPTKIRAWNKQWAYPRMICATMTMFFDDVAKQIDPAKINTYAKDANNFWAVMDSTDAKSLGVARRLGETIPTAEKFATIAQALAGGGYPWTDVYEAYNRVLLFHEHTDGPANLEPTHDSAPRYETELEENREMVDEATELCQHALGGALDRLTAIISTEGQESVMVFNPLARARTDAVCRAGKDLPAEMRLVDAASGSETPHQRLADGSVVFVAHGVPALGYKTFHVVRGDSPQAPRVVRSGSGNVLENRYYRLVFDPAGGAITSIRDKQLNVELVDQAAPYKFAEYLYERFEDPDIHIPSKMYRPHSAQLSVSRGPVASIMRVKATAVGADRLQQTVILYHDLKRIDFRIDLVKSPSGRTGLIPKTSVKNKEAVHVALPLAVADFEIHHELPGCVIQPVRDEFQGACESFYSVRHFSDISNRRYGVTVSATESPLIEYERMSPCPTIGYGPPEKSRHYDMNLPYPQKSWLYLYLLNNMFDNNIAMDQRGPMSFCYSLRTHDGDWKQGGADEFGWDVMNPLLAKVVRGEKHGKLPAAEGSFVNIDQPNVVCTTIKPAEANGAGIILRFHETQGKGTAVTVSIPFVGRITSARATNLVEVDRPNTLVVSNGSEVFFSIEPYGVKTVRVLSEAASGVPAVSGVKATPVSDMEVGLSWIVGTDTAERVSHYNVYRSLAPQTKPGLLQLVQRCPTTTCIDRPRLQYGGWINNRLEPGTTYYYWIAAVDRWNNRGPLSLAVAATTLPSRQKNMLPLRVECLRAILVSPLTPDNFVNLLWRTSCESDVVMYEVYRSKKRGFQPDWSTRIGVAQADTIVAGLKETGHPPYDHLMRDYDHMMYQDGSVLPKTTYYYRVRAVDTAGQRGPFSEEVSVRTKVLP